MRRRRKITLSVPSADFEFLHNYAREHGMKSRSAAIQRAIRLLRASDLGDAYEAEWQEWEETVDAELWEATVGDGLPHS
jgi:hypothetical protein